MFDSANLCDHSERKKREVNVLWFPAEGAEKRGDLFVGCLILRNSAILAGEKREVNVLWFPAEGAEKRRDLFIGCLILRISAILAGDKKESVAC
jgi:hypothetical protein